MKRITFLTAAFLCLSGLTESPAQDTQRIETDPGMGQNVPEER